MPCTDSKRAFTNADVFCPYHKLCGIEKYHITVIPAKCFYKSFPRVMSRRDLALSVLVELLRKHKCMLRGSNEGGGAGGGRTPFAGLASHHIATMQH